MTRKYIVLLWLLIFLTGCNSSTKSHGTISKDVLVISDIEKKVDDSVREELTELEESQNEGIVEELKDEGEIEEVSQEVAIINQNRNVTNNSSSVDTAKQQEDVTSSTESNNTQLPQTETNNDTCQPSKPPTVTEPSIPSNPTYNYTTGNSGLLFTTEAEAYAEAEKTRKEFDDEIKYISRYWVWNTHDKWTIEYEYTYWQ